MSDTPNTHKPGAAQSGTEITPGTDATKGERIAKVLARAGVCSRRDAERLITSGRVSVNGVVLESPAHNVSATDVILVDNKPISAKEPTRLWRYHKPRGQVTTARDPEGRSTVFDALPKNLPRVISIGRLDVNTEGLLLLTNDGELARKLELPATGWARRYRVRAYGRTDQAKLDALEKGIKVDGVQYGPIQARLEREQASNVWITMTLREGKNREIKRVLEALGLTVNRLIRISYGPFQLGDLPEGLVDEVPARILDDQLGETDRKRNRLELPTGTAAPAKKGAPFKKGIAARDRKGPVRPRDERDDALPTREKSGREKPSRENPGRDKPTRDRPAGKPTGRPTGRGKPVSKAEAKADAWTTQKPGTTKKPGGKFGGPKSGSPKSAGAQPSGNRSPGSKSTGPKTTGAKPGGKAGKPHADRRR